jgi:hypothetical protein
MKMKLKQHSTDTSYQVKLINVGRSNFEPKN